MLTDRFFRRISPEPNSGCWLWDGRVDEDGYGRYGIWKKSDFGAHRLAYEFYRGPIPDGMCVLHRCDVRCCVNPDHLFLGSTQDNTADRHTKGRSARGERDGNAKLTAEIVWAIRADTRTHKEIAAAYRTSLANVSVIRARKTWREVV